MQQVNIQAIYAEAEAILQRCTSDKPDNLAAALMHKMNEAQGTINPDYAEVMCGIANFAVSILECMSEDTKQSPQHLRHIFNVMMGRFMASPSIPPKEKFNS